MYWIWVWELTEISGAQICELIKSVWKHIKNVFDKKTCGFGIYQDNSSGNGLREKVSWKQKKPVVFLQISSFGEKLIGQTAGQTEVRVSSKDYDNNGPNGDLRYGKPELMSWPRE